MSDAVAIETPSFSCGGVNADAAEAVSTTNGSDAETDETIAAASAAPAAFTSADADGAAAAAAAAAEDDAMICDTNASH